MARLRPLIVAFVRDVPDARRTIIVRLSARLTPNLHLVREPLEDYWVLPLPATWTGACHDRTIARINVLRWCLYNDHILARTANAGLVLSLHTSLSPCLSYGSRCTLPGLNGEECRSVTYGIKVIVSLTDLDPLGHFRVRIADNGPCR